MDFISNKYGAISRILGKIPTKNHWAYLKKGMPNGFLLFYNKICFFFSIFT